MSQNRNESHLSFIRLHFLLDTLGSSEIYHLRIYSSPRIQTKATTNDDKKKKVEEEAKKKEKKNKERKEIHGKKPKRGREVSEPV